METKMMKMLAVGVVAMLAGTAVMGESSKGRSEERKRRHYEV